LFKKTNLNTLDITYTWRFNITILEAFLIIFIIKEPLLDEARKCVSAFSISSGYIYWGIFI
jgi:hypothetical protein